MGLIFNGLGVFAGMFVLGNVGLVVSAIPAALGKGAPYMPTLRRSLNVMFHDVLPKLKPVSSTSIKEKTPIFVDLGSGDGRVVIEAARNGYHAIGVELNPMLYGLSIAWSRLDKYAHIIMPSKFPKWKQTGSATFYCRNLWNMDLSNSDVILVYGLSPIMDRLSKKLHAEIKDDTIVISNVFKLDHTWRVLSDSKEVYVYAKK